MSQIIAARFETFRQAQGAANALMNSGVSSDDLHTFYVNAPGEHARLSMGGDQLSDSDSTGAAHGAFGGAAILGVAGAVIGALVGFSLMNSMLYVAMGAGLGAYAGSLIGSLSMLGRKKSVDLSDPTESSETEVRSAGVLLAVRVDVPRLQPVADMLRQHGGIEIERAQGRWEAGEWQDFDPLAEQDIQTARL